MIPILVTGGAGYIGAENCKYLRKSGFLPITFDNLSTGHRESVQWGPLIEGDLRNLKQLKKAFDQYRPKAVMHFAASAIISESMAKPELYYDNNIISSIHLLEAMREFDVTSLVFSSTCATYGNATQIPITEEHPQNPINPYGTSKLIVEKIIREFGEIHGIHSAILRYFNACGADLDMEHGEDHSPETHIIPLLLQLAMKMRDHFSIYGTDFPTRDGSAVRDYIHIQDLARAHVKALVWILSQKKNLTLNLGTGKGISVLEIIREIEKVTNEKLPIQKREKRKGEPAELIASYEKAKTILGFEPKYSDIQTIIESAWSWHKKKSKVLL